MIVWLVAVLALCLAPIACLKVRQRRLMSLRWPRHQGFFEMQRRLQQYLLAHGWEVREGGLAGIDRLIAMRGGSGPCVLKCCLSAPDTRARAVKDFSELSTFAPGRKHLRIMVMEEEVPRAFVEESFSRNVIVMHYKQLGALARLHPACPRDVEACLVAFLGEERSITVTNVGSDQCEGDRALPLPDGPKTSSPAPDRGADVKRLLEAGRACLQKREAEAAASAFREAMALAPAHVGALSGLAAALNQQGRAEEALEWSSKAVALAPGNAGLNAQLAQLLSKLGRWTEANDAFEAALAIDPNAASTHAALSATLKQQGKIEEAIASLRSAIEANPANAQFYVDLGNLFISSRGDQDEAEIAFRAALGRDRRHGGALIALANILLQKNNAREAIGVLRSAIADMPKNFALNLRLGQILEEQHDIGAAHAAFRTAASIDPGNEAAAAGVQRTRDPAHIFGQFEHVFGDDATPDAFSALAADLQISESRLRTLMEFARNPSQTALSDVVETALEHALLHAVLVAASRETFAAKHGFATPQPRFQVAASEVDPVGVAAAHESWGAVQWLNAFMLRKTRPSRLCALVATMRDEGVYLLEWVAHYRVLGFDDIIIYSNDNVDGSEMLLRGLAEHGVITYIENQMSPERTYDPQKKAYGHALHLLPQLWEHEWVLFADADEFLLPSEKYGFRIAPLLEDALAHFPNRAPSAICLNWLWYVSGYAYSYDPKPVLRRFSHANGRRGMKSLVRLRDITSMHRIHYPDIAADGFLARADFTPLEWSLRQKKLDPVFTSASLAHYFNKSFEEYAIKKARGDSAGAHHPIWKRGFEEFFTTNALETPQNFCPVPEALISAVEAEMRILQDLPGIAGLLDDLQARRVQLLSRFDRDGGLPTIYASMKAATVRNIPARE